MLLLPPAPAARVLLGRALAIFSFWSAAARRRIWVLAPPGGAGDEGRTEAPEAAAPGAGDEGRGEDCQHHPRQQVPQGIWKMGMQEASRVARCRESSEQ